MSEYILNIVIEELDEGGYVATSPDLQGLIAQGRTIQETMEIAQDVARKIIESCIEHNDPLPEAMKEPHHIKIEAKIPVMVATP